MDPDENREPVVSRWRMALFVVLAVVVLLGWATLMASALGAGGCGPVTGWWLRRWLGRLGWPEDPDERRFVLDQLSIRLAIVVAVPVLIGVAYLYSLTRLP